MKVLFDQGVPAPLRHALSAHTVSTAHEMGWSELSNGMLLKAANEQFDVLITTDQSLRFQQNLAGLRLAIIVLPTTNWPAIRQQQETITAAVSDASSGTIVALNWP